MNLSVSTLLIQGDANRSYSDDDRSSCNFEENDKQKDSLHLSGNKKYNLWGVPLAQSEEHMKIRKYK